MICRTITVLSIFFLCVCPSLTKAQGSFYDDIELGEYHVGYFDSLIFDQAQGYKQYGYDGPMPVFLQVWHPLKGSAKGNYLSYRDFRKRNLPGELTLAYSRLCGQMDESFIAYNIVEDFHTWDSIDYGEYTYQDVLEDISGYKTRSIYSRPNTKSSSPVIIYHHGSQGLSDENFIMAEYFASRGYIFVSANYHLPYEGSDYGSTEAFSGRATDLPKIVSRFSKELTTSDFCFYVGHSWGAQVGFLHLYEEGLASGFVSMETTIEPKTDSSEIMEKWSEVYQVIKVEGRKYPMPILMFGGNGSRNPFPFFENISSTDKVMYASTKEEFGHESYTSAYLLRSYYTDKYKQPDSEAMKSQVQLYHRHLELMHSFFAAVREDRVLETKPFEKDFYFH